MFDSPEWTGIYPETTKPEPKQKLVGVRFQPVGKVYHYNQVGFDDLKVGEWVVVDTVRGRQMGQIATFKPPKDPQGGYKKIERRATGRDMAMRHYYEGKELEAMIACRAESAALNLPVKVVRAEYSFDGQTLTFLYSSDQEERVEVGALREAISRLYRARIEMRQISPREVAKIIGGMGACGIEERCCSRFLTEFSPISIKHAKEQNLSLNPHDITGMCGRLRCCLIYEYEQYVEARRHLPKLKAVIGTPAGPGKVIEILHLMDSVKVRVGDGPEARNMIFHREQLIPLEELKRLQDKAASGTCDRHDSGQCDCGRGRAEGREGSGAEGQGRKGDLPPAAKTYIQANEEKQRRDQQGQQAQGKRREDRERDRDRDRRDRRPNANDVRRPQQQPQPQAKRDPGADAGTQPDQQPGDDAAGGTQPQSPNDRNKQRKPLLKRNRPDQSDQTGQQ
jgi:cell fate regulator YaaT (PSP1 superfamily)